MASRMVNVPRSRATRQQTKVHDENAAPIGGAGPLRSKASIKDIGTKKAFNGAVTAVIAEGATANAAAVKAGSKRPALSTVSGNGYKDPHVDTDIPLKATRLTTKSRSPSASIAGQTIESVVKGVTTSTSVNGISNNNNNVGRSLTSSSSAVITGRPTAPLPRHGASRSIASTSELMGRDVIEEEQYKRVASVDSMVVEEEMVAKVKPSDSGLTPSLGDLGVMSHEFDLSSNIGGMIEGGSSFAGDIAGDVAGVDELAEDGLDEEEEEDEDDWLRLSPGQVQQVEGTLMRIRESFQDEIDLFDTTMVAEYADDIFHYMGDLEESVMPNPHYMEHQTEIEWGMRSTLIDWLLQVHLRYHMLPETLWIAVNIVDRFLSQRVVSLVKLQLVGVTAMFVAAKYEEILAPSVDEFVYMTENGYTKDEILKGERIILQTLNFEISSYCSPYSWVRKISKADDYDIQTRTLSKFLMEVTLLDHRFLRARPSMIAAIGMYLARLMLDGDWNEAFVYYSNYTETQLLPGAQILCEQLSAPDFDKQYVYKKYSNKKFLRASLFALQWSVEHAHELQLKAQSS